MRWPFTRRCPPAPLPEPRPVPLHTPRNTPPAEAVPLVIALRIARKALDRHQDANIHSKSAMYFAAYDLNHALRLVVAALAYPQDS